MELLLSVAESAHRLGIGKTRFFELLKAEELHAVQLGGYRSHWMPPAGYAGELSNLGNQL